jgi:hypothetical protein
MKRKSKIKKKKRSIFVLGLSVQKLLPETKGQERQHDKDISHPECCCMDIGIPMWGNLMNSVIIICKRKKRNAVFQYHKNHY